MDNDPDALRDWCRHSGAKTAYIEPGAPWENGWIESFNGRLRDECLNIEDFAKLTEARVAIEDWHHDYNHHRPHRSLGDSPWTFAQAPEIGASMGSVDASVAGPSGVVPAEDLFVPGEECVNDVAELGYQPGAVDVG